MENTITLNNGVEMPLLGIGTFRIRPEDAEKSVEYALKNGYRLIDTANLYMNEKAVGRGIKKSGVPREGIFVTTKLWPTEYPFEQAKKAIDDTLKRLDTEYVDLLLLHQDVGDIEGAWKAMEQAVDAGKVKAIGISNFSDKTMQRILSVCRIKPAVLQTECHPYLQETALKERLSKDGIHIMAWYPLGSANKKLLNEEVFTRLAKKYNKSNVQIILRWHTQAGNIVIPGSKNQSHIQSNGHIFDFELTRDEMKEINALNKNKHYAAIPAFIKKLLFTRGNRDYNKQL
ncbi:MAG: aldo/keto reductase [Sporolactobacillus sp.]